MFMEGSYFVENKDAFIHLPVSIHVRAHETLIGCSRYLGVELSSKFCF